MKGTALEIALYRWPYGLEVKSSTDGLVVRPRRKARENWAKRFRRPTGSSDDLGATRSVINEFDRKEWEW